jgi:hypothetical protein
MSSLWLRGTPSTAGRHVRYLPGAGSTVVVDE